MTRGYLVLEDGTVYEGNIFGHRSSTDGEVIFGTGMSGYQESLTDPSLCGQILVMTYPLIGDYGIIDEYSQSEKVQVRGLVVRENCVEPSDMYKGSTLDSFLKKHKVPGISGIDTRDLVIRLRDHGSMKGAITDIETSPEDTAERLRSMPLPATSNLVAKVSSKKIFKIKSNKELTIGILDCGTKSAIVDNLSSRYNVITFPYDTPADVILEYKVDGLVISNGPGNPSHKDILNTVVKTEKDLISALPMYGICFGSQTLALAMGAKTYKMKFGHHGNNQPVLFEGRVYITSQNHGYAVDADSLDGTDLTANHININDKSVEGCIHRDLPIFTTQYHPEAKPGPADTLFLFDRFGKVIKEARK
ncbi:MAG TPA: glutamine-hydrolyzing carbamoyl-phosphate synthase small subunit [Candidatus Methanomethylophilaceae archaeon]|nr:glutamine-hydrolyzing carbamoyl-phosphate synthase small subunit [Candidatus Methanomethylophilaceae archaeon]